VASVRYKANSAVSADGVKASYFAVKIKEAIRGCPDNKQPIILCTPLLKALSTKFHVSTKHHPAYKRANLGDHFEQINMHSFRKVSLFSFLATQATRMANPRHRTESIKVVLAEPVCLPYMTNIISPSAANPCKKILDKWLVKGWPVCPFVRQPTLGLLQQAGFLPRLVCFSSFA